MTGRIEHFFERFEFVSTIIEGHSVDNHYLDNDLGIVVE